MKTGQSYIHYTEKYQMLGVTPPCLADFFIWWQFCNKLSFNFWSKPWRFLFKFEWFLLYLTFPCHAGTAPFKLNLLECLLYVSGMTVQCWFGSWRNCPFPPFPLSHTGCHFVTVIANTWAYNCRLQMFSLTIAAFGLATNNDNNRLEQ